MNTIKLELQELTNEEMENINGGISLVLIGAGVVIVGAGIIIKNWNNE